MKLLILDENYPHLDNLMGDVFVHVRAKEYAKKHQVKVFSFFHEPKELVYEGIEVEMFDDKEKLSAAVKAFHPDKILIHFYQSWMLDLILRKTTVPVIIWVHGYEALGWYRRLFNYTWYSPVLLNYIKKNTYQQWQFRKMIRYANRTGQIQFVFVSDWMRRITEWDTLSKIKQKTIIANPIDTELFSYKQKDPELRKDILLLRSFGSNKYANDISAKAIQLLSVKPFFSELHFTIIGKGQLFQKITEPLKQFQNVDLQERAVRQVMIPELHAQHGIFLCPTRQDAQGVSMCEAMSSGLVPITSNNTAIPEFVTDRETGFVTNSAKEVADAVEVMYHQPELFQKISAQTAASVKQICSLQTIVTKELKLIEHE
ncbi:MAG: glycosyltransferase family 4 protein [Lacibacter sp.]